MLVLSQLVLRADTDAQTRNMEAGVPSREEYSEIPLHNGVARNGLEYGPHSGEKHSEEHSTLLLAEQPLSTRIIQPSGLLSQQQ